LLKEKKNQFSWITPRNYENFGLTLEGQNWKAGLFRLCQVDCSKYRTNHYRGSNT